MIPVAKNNHIKVLKRACCSWNTLRNWQNRKLLEIKLTSSCYLLTFQQLSTPMNSTCCWINSHSLVSVGEEFKDPPSQTWVNIKVFRKCMSDFPLLYILYRDDQFENQYPKVCRWFFHDEESNHDPEWLIIFKLLQKRISLTINSMHQRQKTRVHNSPSFMGMTV